MRKRQATSVYFQRVTEIFCSLAMSIVIMGAGSSQAQQERGERFRRLDRNNDGAVSKDEVLEPLWRRLSMFDLDGDGKITGEELMRQARQRNEQGSGMNYFANAPMTQWIELSLQTSLRIANPHRPESGLRRPGSNFTQGYPGDDYELTVPFETEMITGELGGFDTFLAVDPAAEYPGKDRVVTLYGSPPLYPDRKGDRFVLGGSRQVFFLGDARMPEPDRDFAYVVNLQLPGAEVVLHGKPEDYQLVTARSPLQDAVRGAYGSAIVYVGDGGSDLIAYLVGHEFRDLRGAPFVYEQGREMAGSFRILPRDVMRLDQFGGSGVDLALDIETVPGSTDVVVMGINRSSSPADRVYGAGKLYLARYTSSGQRVWITRFGSAGGELDLAMDLLVTNTSACATGRYLSSLRAGQKDHFVTRFSLADGEQFGSAVWDGIGPQFGANVTLGSHLFATGIGLTPYNRRPDEFGAGQDPFLEKRDPDSLALLKRVTFGEGANREPWGGLVWKPDKTDSTKGTLYSAGWTFGQFDDEREPENPKTADRNAWIAAFDQDLNLLWSETFGDKRWPDWPWDLALDGDGYLYVCGHTLGAVTSNNRQFGEGDGFVLKLDTNLTSGKRILWAKNYGTTSSDDLKRLCYRDGRLYASGHTYGDFAGEGNAGRSDAWVMVIDAHTGDVLKRLQFGTDKDERAVLTVNDGGIFVAGSTEGELAGPHNGSADAYLLKINL